MPWTLPWDWRWLPERSSLRRQRPGGEPFPTARKLFQWGLWLQLQFCWSLFNLFPFPRQLPSLLTAGQVLLCADSFGLAWNSNSSKGWVIQGQPFAACTLSTPFSTIYPPCIPSGVSSPHLLPPLQRRDIQPEMLVIKDGFSREFNFKRAVWWRK